MNANMLGPEPQTSMSVSGSLADMAWRLDDVRSTCKAAIKRPALSCRALVQSRHFAS